MAHVESGFNSKAVSRRGARGVLQIMPSTAKSYGVSREELFNPDVNIRLGLTYFKELCLRFNDRALALAAYNSGLGQVIDAGNKIPDFKETKKYVRRVNELSEKYSRAGYYL